MSHYDVSYKPSFVRKLNKLDPELAKDAIEKIGLIRDPKKHKMLGVHKLQGALKDYFSFSINFRYRIIFQFLTKSEIVLLTIGDHDIYR